MSSVTVICPNARRCKISVKPMTQIGEVLEEACLSQGYDVDLYELQHHGKTIDEAITFRLSSLSNNANLELVSSKRKSTVDDVEIALQTPDGRKIKRFSNNLTLIDVINGFTQEFGKNLLELKDGEHPVITYLSKQWKTINILSATKLKSIGLYSGRALLRYSVEQLNQDEVKQLLQNLADSESRRNALVERYKKQKADHIAREKMEETYQNDLTKRMEAERIKQEEEAKKFAEETAQKEKEDNKKTNERNMQVDDEIPSSSSVNIHPTRNSSEIDRLEATLRILNSSLQSGRSDSLVDQLLTESGTLRNDVEMEDLTAAASRPFEPPSYDFSNFKFPEKKIDVPYDTPNEVKIVEEINEEPPESRQIVFFDRTLSEEKRKEIQEVDDDVYEPTLKDIKILQRELSEQVKEQRAFVPKSFIDAKNKERKTKAYKHTVIRFLLPENKTIQACFYSKESVYSVYEFINSILTSSAVKYDLVFFLKEKLKSDKFKNLIDAGLAPKSNLILNIKDVTSIEGISKSFKHDKFQKVTLDDADIISKNWLSINSKFEPFNPTVAPGSQTAQLKRVAQSRTSDETGAPPARRTVEGFPKWFKK